jgi:exodeoxyribonuclease VII small subunit
MTMAKNQKKNDISEKGFEESIKELTEIVSRIEQGEIALESSLEQYERGMALIKHCKGILEKAEKRIEKISGGESRQ